MKFEFANRGEYRRNENVFKTIFVLQSVTFQSESVNVVAIATQWEVTKKERERTPARFVYPALEVTAASVAYDKAFGTLPRRRPRPNKRAVSDVNGSRRKHQNR